MKDTITKNLTEKRFRVTLFLLRLGGVSIYKNKTSVLSFMYNSTVTICAYSFFFFMVISLIMHRDDLKRAMKTFRVILSCILIFWMHLNIR